MISWSRIYARYLEVTQDPHRCHLGYGKHAEEHSHSHDEEHPHSAGHTTVGKSDIAGTDVTLSVSAVHSLTDSNKHQSDHPSIAQE